MADTGGFAQGGLAFGRASWIALKGGFGMIKVGRQSLPVFSNSEIFDPFGDVLAGDSARIFNYSGFRVNNSISCEYGSNGLKGPVIYGFGEVPGNNSGKRTIAAALNYANGPIEAVLTHTAINNALGDDSAKTTLIGGNYNLDVVRLFAAYARNKGTGTLDTRDALVGVTIPVAQSGKFIASYIRKTDRFKSDANAKQVALGYVYDLSKRTALYASWSQTNNDKLASYNAGAPGATDKLFNAGIRHKF